VFVRYSTVRWRGAPNYVVKCAGHCGRVKTIQGHAWRHTRCRCTTRLYPEGEKVCKHCARREVDGVNFGTAVAECTSCNRAAMRNGRHRVVWRDEHEQQLAPSP